MWGIKRNKDDENPFVGERDPDWIVDVLAHGGPEQAAWYAKKLAEKREYAGVGGGTDEDKDAGVANAEEAASADYDSDDEVMEAQRVEGENKGPSIKRYEPAPRLTPNEDDERSLNRALDKRLYLAVQHKETGAWGLPALPFDIEDADDISMADTAKVALLKGAGKRLSVHYPSNCPSIVQWQKLDDDSYFGEKTFTFRAELMGPQNLTLDKRMYSDYAWLSKDALLERLGDEHDKVHLGRILVDW